MNFPMPAPGKITWECRLIGADGHELLNGFTFASTLGEALRLFDPRLSDVPTFSAPSRWEASWDVCTSVVLTRGVTS